MTAGSGLDVMQSLFISGSDGLGGGGVVLSCLRLGEQTAAVFCTAGVKVVPLGEGHNSVDTRGNVRAAAVTTTLPSHAARSGWDRCDLPPAAG